MRFVLGHWPEDPERERAVDQEEAEQGDILRLPVKETYTNLPMKVRVLCMTVIKAQPGHAGRSAKKTGQQCSCSVAGDVVWC